MEIETKGTGKLTNILLSVILAMMSIIGYFYIMDRNYTNKINSTQTETLAKIVEGQNTQMVQNTKEHGTLELMINKIDNKAESNSDNISKIKENIGLY